MRRWVGGALDRLIAAGALPTDTPEVRLRKGILTFVAVLVACASTFWVVAYFALRLPSSAVIPLVYQLASATSIVLFVRNKRFSLFRDSQLCMILLLPGLLQWSLGGFVAGSAVVLWASLAPLGALVFHGARGSLPWLAAYVLEVVALGLADGALAAHPAPLPPGVVTLFFVMNVSTVSAVVYAVVRYFAARMEEAQAQSERLLLNVLPAPIAARLKAGEEPIADGYAEATVLFADIVDFTGISGRCTPDQMVETLNAVFTEFDRLAARHGLEKIKTVGDAYMVVGGLPAPRPDHAEAVVAMALDMLAALEGRIAPTGDPLRVRVGVNTGPVVAGVIGTAKFAYDLWGDAVNTASRMESHGVPGAIQVTRATYERLRDRYAFEERGEVEVKGKGRMPTYLLVGPASSSRRTSAAAALR